MRSVAVFLGLVLVLLAFGPAAGALAPVAGPDEHAHGHADEPAPTSSSIFNGLFGHLTPHAVTALWFGGEHGFGLVSPGVIDEHGEPVMDSHGHAVTYETSAAFTAARGDEFGGGMGMLIHNIVTVQWIAGGVLILIMLWVASRARKLGAAAPKGGVYGLFESLILFVRDEMVYATMGRENGRPYVPLFLTFFFFILFLNLFGLVPDVFGTGLLGTATANLMVTGALALTTAIVIHVAGIKQHGLVHHFKNFAPPGIPTGVLFILVPIELFGVLIVKPGALAVRLFANLTAGHLVLLSFLGLVQLIGLSMSTGAAYATGWLPLAMAIAISCLELFVSFLQAYIFTYLSIVFVGASVHPEH